MLCSYNWHEAAKEFWIFDNKYWSKGSSFGSFDLLKCHFLNGLRLKHGRRNRVRLHYMPTKWVQIIRIAGCDLRETQYRGLDLTVVCSSDRFLYLISKPFGLFKEWEEKEKNEHIAAKICASICTHKAAPHLEQWYIYDDDHTIYDEEIIERWSRHIKSRIIEIDFDNSSNAAFNNRQIW
jgi:hypothetical protein